MDIRNNILEAIGNTPLVRLNKLVEPGWSEVLVKCEFMNPAGSIKDRMACYIIEQAEKEGLLGPGGTIVENTSGNTGLGAAMTAAVKGYRCVFTMPDKMSKEKIDGLRAFGAEVVITPTDVPGDSPDHYVNVAKRIAEETPGAFYMNQYHSQWNIQAHEHLTGPEIWKQTDGGQIDAIVIGTGTGGTISGVGRFFKKQGSKTKIIGVDPLGSVHYHYFKTGTLSTPYVYKVEGLGEDIKCEAFDPSVVDEMYQVSDYECFTTARRLTREEGLFCGGSSGGMVHVALQLARQWGKGKRILAILPDSGTRYVTKYLNDEWMRMHGFLEPDRGLGSVSELLRGRDNTLLTIHENDSIASAIAVMRERGVSQLPVVDDDGRPIGMVHEVDILRGLQSGDVSTDSAIKGIEKPIGGLVYPQARIEELFAIFGQDQAAIVIDEARVVAVLTQIDLIEFLARRPSR
ncbi:MAG: cystathionine beta-synthase [Phycisphaerales bacterium]